MQSWVGRLPLEMHGELGRWTPATRNVWRVGERDAVLEMYGELGRGTTVLEMYGELGRKTTATRNVWRVG